MTVDLENAPLVKDCQRAAGKRWRDPDGIKIFGGKVTKLEWVTSEGSLFVEAVPGGALWRFVGSKYKAMGTELEKVPWEDVR